MTTEDGSYGETGRVDQVVQRLLRENPDLTVLACGPTPMLKAISAVTAGGGERLPGFFRGTDGLWFGGLSDLLL